MPEYGSYGPSMDKYKKLDADEDSLEADNSNRDALIEKATFAFGDVSGNLTPELQEKFQQILDDAQTYYDFEPALGAEILESAENILMQFVDLSDETEIEEKAQEIEPEIESLNKMSGRLVKKGTTVH